MHIHTLFVVLSSLEEFQTDRFELFNHYFLSMQTINLLIKGKVQGVFYRAAAKEMADKIGIKGWVKNIEGGRVEAMATGTEDQIAQFIQWCKQGPARAQVTDVIVTTLSLQIFDDFFIIR